VSDAALLKEGVLAIVESSALHLIRRVEGGLVDESRQRLRPLILLASCSDLLRPITRQERVTSRI